MLRVADYKTAASGFMVAVAYWPGMLSPAYVPRWAALAIALPLLMNLDPRSVPSAVRGSLLFVLAMALIATAFTSPDSAGGYLELFYGALLCLALCAGANLIRIDDLMLGAGAGLALSSVLAVTQYTGLWSPIPQTSIPAGLFHNSEVLGEFAALILTWAIVRRNWVLVVVGAIPVALCGSRVAVLMVAVGLLYAFWPRAWWLRFGVTMAVIAAAVASLILLKSGSADHRLTLWVATVFSWKLFGNGLGWFQANYPQEGFAHSDALQAVGEIGIGALALLTIPVVVFWRKRGTDAERATFLAGCIACVVSFPLHFPASAFVLAMLAGFLVSDWGHVRVPQHQRGPQDGSGRRGTDATGHRHFGGLSGGGSAVSVGSVHSAAAPDEPEQYRCDPRGA